MYRTGAFDPAGAPLAARLALRLFALLVPLIALPLTGCATLAPKLESPTLTVTGVQIVGGTFQQQMLHLTIHVVNPNARSIDVRGIDCSLEVAGEAFASGSSDAPFTLPASGETDFGLNVSAHLDAGLAALLGGLGHRTVDYHFYGVVHLAQGLVRNIPFDQRSRLRF